MSNAWVSKRQAPWAVALGCRLALGPLDDALRRRLAAESVESQRLLDRAMIKTTAIVPDMVRSLQRFTVTFEDQLQLLNAMADGWRGIIEIVDLERELRPWAACDP